MMNDDYIQPRRVNVPNTSADTDEQETTVDRVFDISDEGIKPINETAPIKPAAAPVSQPVPASQPSPAKPGRPYIPPDADLLDKKIGTFDSSPFAQPVLVQKKPEPMPIQDFSASLNKARGIEQPVQPKISLQDEIASALPANLRPKMPAPILAPTPAPAQPAMRPPVPAPTEKEDVEPDTAKPVRTYEADVAEAMSHKRTSRASMAIAESKRQEGEERIGNSGTQEESSHVGRKLFMALVSLIFLGGGVLGAYYLYLKSPLAPAPVPAQQNKQASIVPSDMQIVVTIDPQSALLSQNRIRAEIDKIQTPNTITEMVIGASDASGKLMRVTGPEMVSAMDLNAPDILLRSMTDAWMLGVYVSQNGEKSAFVVVTTNFFQNAFAGMLQWESVMADDLKQYLYPAARGIANVSGTTVPVADPLSGLNSILPTTSSTTATTTQQASTTVENLPPIQPYFTLKGKFEDRIVRNKDVRAFRTDDGKILFLYSFIDSTHLAVTSSESTLAEILTRLEKQSFIR